MQQSRERRSNPERTEATRTALVAAARALFCAKGYAETSTPEIVAAAAVTRGALYHHFADKADLFRAVLRAEAEAVAAAIDADAVEAATPAAALARGADAYFEAMRQPGRARLMLVEAPAVLGLQELRQIDRETGGGTLRQGLRSLVGEAATEADVAALADLVSAMFDRAALAIAAGDDVEPYRAALLRLLAAMAP